MALIDGSHEITTQTTTEFWQDELVNSKVLLVEIEKAILTITQQNHQSYKLNSGQSSQTVTRADLPSLINRRQELIGQIRQIEILLGVGNPSVITAKPGW